MSHNASPRFGRAIQTLNKDGVAFVVPLARHDSYSNEL